MKETKLTFNQHCTVEKEKFENALKDFSIQMSERFDSKCKEGWTGWDEPSYFNGMAKRMCEKSTRVAYNFDKADRKKDLIDIANFALFLFKIEERK